MAILGGATARADPSDPLWLYHVFKFSAQSHWTSVSITMTAGDWRIGRPDGPRATQAQLTQVLDSLGTLVVGGDCAGAGAGSTHYPSALELAHPKVDGKELRVDTLGDSWRATVGDTLTRFDVARFRATSLPPSDDSVSPLPPSIYVSSGFLGLMPSPAVPSS